MITPGAYAMITQALACYRQLGVGWRKHRPSIERLSAMLARGRPLPMINPVVDIYNLASITARMCMGVHDGRTIGLPIRLRRTTGAEAFTPLGGPPETLPAGEFAYVDTRARVICRLDAVQADFSKVTLETRTVILIVEGSPATSRDDLVAAVRATACDIAEATGGTVAWQALAEAS